MLDTKQAFEEFMKSSAQTKLLRLDSKFYSLRKVYIGYTNYIAVVEHNTLGSMRGFKAFNKDWTCRDKRYEVGKTFKEDIEMPIPCIKGMHFCVDPIDIFYYYDFDFRETRVAEVEATGVITTMDAEKFCTNKLRIIREVPPYEVLTYVRARVGDVIMDKFPFQIRNIILNSFTETIDAASGNT